VDAFNAQLNREYEAMEADGEVAACHASADDRGAATSSDEIGAADPEQASPRPWELDADINGPAAEDERESGLDSALEM
jgi:hypothetical protein